jgi:glycosyltransferase involved in cell wall biosynthesis/GT2 family glycosyltransferase
MDQVLDLGSEAKWAARAGSAERPGGAGPGLGGPGPIRPAAQPVTPVSFSVIVSTFNRAATLADCLISLRQQTHPAFEVIVVVGPCNDATPLVLAEHGPRCKVVHCAERNLSRSRNLGLAAAAGDVCAFIDDDAVAHPRWLERLGWAYADEAVGGAGGFTVDNTGTAFQCRYTVCDRFGNATLLDHIDPASRLAQAGMWLFPSLLGTNSSFRTALLRRIGGFDERFEYMLDETDVCLRLADQGHRIVTEPGAVVFHRYAESHIRDQRRIAKTQLAPSRSKAHFVFKHTSARLPLADLSAELDRFRTDLRFSNRWHVDRAMIESRHFLKLNNEVDAGIQEGIESGARAAERPDAAPPARLAAAPEPFRTYRTETSTGGLRIALVSQGFPPRDTSGIARWTDELSQALAARGHVVHVITAADGPRTIEYRHGVWVHAVPPEHGATARAPVDLPPGIQARAAAVLAEARRIIAAFGLDVLSAPIWDVEGILCAATLDIPVITSLHTAYRMVLPLKERWRADLSFRLHHVEKVIAAETWLLRHSRLLLANSREICVELASLYGVALAPSRVALVPHGVSPAPAPVPGEIAVARERKGRLDLLFVGRIERRKGLDLLIEALLPLFGAYAELRLDVVGAPVPEEEAYTALIERLQDDLAARGHAERVTFHGYVDEAALAAHYAACDVFVVPSRFESFGLIAIEAMRFARPVVAAAVGGLAEIIEPGLTGVLFAPDSADALRLALAGLLADPAERRRMGRHAAAAFAERFTSVVMARNVERCLHDLLGTRVRGLEEADAAEVAAPEPRDDATVAAAA